MHRAWISRFSGTRARQRTRVVALGLALCFWLVAVATHIHRDGGDLSASEPSTACSFCLSLPVGAPAPAHAPVAQVVFAATDVAVEFVATFVALDVPSFYLCRGPPAL